MWWLNMVWDHRPDRTPFKGIALQRLNSELQLEGDTKIIATGSDVGLIEGPTFISSVAFTTWWLQRVVPVTGTALASRGAK